MTINLIGSTSQPMITHSDPNVDRAYLVGPGSLNAKDFAGAFIDQAAMKRGQAFCPLECNNHFQLMGKSMSSSRNMDEDYRVSRPTWFMGMFRRTA